MDAERPAPAQLAKGALRRLALSKREPTPANFARAYAEEAGDTVPAEGGYAVWMPFQKGQAKAQVASELTSQIADDGKAMAKFIMPGGSVVKVGGIPVRLDHPCVALTHPDNLNMVLGALRDGQACKT